MRIMESFFGPPICGNPCMQASIALVQLDKTGKPPTTDHCCQTVIGISHMGGCPNHGPFLGPLNTRCRIIIRTQRRIIILTTTHIVALGAVKQFAKPGIQTDAVLLPGCIWSRVSGREACLLQRPP